MLRPVGRDGRGSGTVAGRYCSLVWRHHRLVLALALGIGLGSAWLASRLELRASFVELLRSQDPAVQELHRVAGRLSGTLVLEIAVESPSREANRRCAAAIAERLGRLGPHLVRSVVADVRAERAFFASHR